MLYGLLQIPSVQTRIVKAVAERLSSDMGTRVSVDHVNIRFFNKLQLEGLYIEDKKKDTLLFAGKVQVDINNWFFFKDKIILHDINLEDGFINLNRKDSVWNYAFMEDYFGGGSSGGKRKGKATDIRLKKLELKNIRIHQRDGWIGQDMILSLSALSMKVNKLENNSKVLDIGELKMTAPSFAQIEYKGNRPKRLKSKAKEAELPLPGVLQWNTDDWKVRIGSLQIKDGSLQVDKETDRPAYADRFDGEHLHFRNLSGDFRELTITGDTIRAAVSIKAAEKSGFRVKQLNAGLRFTPEIMEFNELTLETNNSSLGNYFAMHYDSFLEDMNDFMSDVRMEGRFNESELKSDDLAFFDPYLSGWKRKFKFSGRAEGSVEALKAESMDIRSGDSRLTGNLSLNGLPDLDSTRFDISNGYLQTTAAEITGLFPALKGNSGFQFEKFGNIQYFGDLRGNLEQFLVKGNVKTDMGNASTDLQISLPQSGSPSYQGDFFTTGLDIGTLAGMNEKLILSYSGKINGRGTTLKDIRINTEGKIGKLIFGEKEIQGIDISAGLKDSLLTFNLGMENENLRIPTMEGKIVLGKESLEGNLAAEISHANLNGLALTDKEILFSGILTGSFKGNDLNDITGDLKIFEANLEYQGKSLPFDSLTLISSVRSDLRKLSLESNEISAAIEGNFELGDLPTDFQFFLNRYYPAYFDAPDNINRSHRYDYSIEARDLDPYISLFSKDFGGFNDLKAKGQMNLQDSLLSLKLRVPTFVFKNRYFNDFELISNGNADSLDTRINIYDVGLTDSLHLPDTKLKIVSANNLSKIKLRTSATEALNEADLNASMEAFPDGLSIQFEPSSFIVNDNKWTLENNGRLTIRNDLIEAKDILFKEEDQQIRISTAIDESSGKPMLVAELKNVNVEDFTPFLFTDPVLQGKVTGKATVRNPLTDIAVDFSGNAEEFYMNDSYIGHLEMNAVTDPETGKLSFSGRADNERYDFGINGSYNLRDTTAQDMFIDLIGKKINLKLLEPYMEGIFSNIDGLASSQLRITRDAKGSYLTGSVMVEDAALQVAFTQCRYFIKNEEIRFRKNEIEIPNIRLKDERGNQGSLSGSIRHEFFDNFSFRNIRLETSRMKLLNTTRNDNSQFYGQLTGSALMTLNGPISNLLMKIDGQPGILDSSQIYISASDSKESNLVDYIEFQEFGKAYETELPSNDELDLVVDLNIAANPACKVDVILDEATGDVIKGSGSGLINVRVGNREPLTVRGNYELSNGEYTFNFQTFFKRPFTLKRGTLSWSGNPYEAILDIDAEYLAKNVDISSILQSGGYKKREDIIILSHLKGKLSSPEIDFEFKVPERSELNRDYITLKKLQDMQNDENERNKQVASLLLFNTFLTENQNFFSGQNTLSFATSTVGGILSSWLTNLFNKELEKATNGILSTYIDINPTLNQQQNVNELQANVRAGLKLLLSNRIVFLVGGNLEYNNPYIPLQRKGLLTPDINLEWLLNKEGSIRVVGFHRSSFDFSLGQRNRSGAQLSYRKDFDRLGDIFKSRRKIEEDRVKQELKAP